MNNVGLQFRKNLDSLSSALNLSSLILSKELRAGIFRSRRYGQGSEFCGVREYQLGDSVRSIDWNVTARMNRAFVKMYEEESDLNVLILLDGSASMVSSLEGKFRASAWSAALSLASCKRQSGSVGAILFDDEVRFCAHPSPKKENALLILSKIDAFESSKKNGTALSSALKLAASILKKKSLVLIFSDFRVLKKEWIPIFSVLSNRHDVVLAKIESRFEKSFPRLGLLPFFDAEGGEKRELPLFSRAFLSEWKNAASSRDEFLKEAASKGNASVIFLPFSENPFDYARALSNFFCERRKP